MFAKSIDRGDTAESETITLTINKDGSATEFFIAGKFGKPSVLTPASLAQGGRDAVMIVLEGDAMGEQLAKHAVMVRVRKAMRSSNSSDPKLNDLELFELLKAMRSLHFDQNAYERYVFIHRLATGEGRFPDQAHNGPAFIAWHRAFLLQFERDLQRIAPHVSLPYWVQNERQDFFSLSRFGVNDGDEIVTFERYSPSAGSGSPLHGWSISLPHAGTSTAMGALERQDRNHNIPRTQATYQGFGSRLQRLSSFRDALPNVWVQLGLDPVLNLSNPNFNIERNPHNNGHNNVGHSSTWMMNCRESNADPVFWVFHANHDYLWAKWQHYHNRFQSTRGSSDHYWPSDAYTDRDANQLIPRGHHLLDPMWPWDESSNAQFPGERPTRSFEAFGSSGIPGIWPEQDAKPRPADTIDYMGMLNRENDMGYCYDDVDWGFRNTRLTGPGRRPVRDDARAGAILFMSEKLSLDTRLLGSSAQGDSRPFEVEKLAKLAKSNRENVDIRNRSLQLLAAKSSVKAIEIATEILVDKKANFSLRQKSLETINSHFHFTPMKHANHYALTQKLTNLLTEENTPNPLRRQLLTTLAPMGDKQSGDILADYLRSPSKSLFPLPKVIRMLKHFPEHLELVRNQLDSPTDEIAVSAIEVLMLDGKSISKRIQIALDELRSGTVRTAAVQSLMYFPDTDSRSALLKIFESNSNPIELRSEAIAAARVNVERDRKKLDTKTKDQLKSQVEKVETADHKVTEFGALKHDFLILLEKKTAK